MSLLETDLGNGRRWAQIGDYYAITKKPRDLNLSSFETIPFAPMDAIPQGGAYASEFILKPPDKIASGTYFERGDVLVAKITPSFENGKQAFVFDLPMPFGYATTEIIPLHPRDTKIDRRFLFFYLLHPDIRNYIADRMEGSTGRQRIPNNVLLDLPFPIFNSDDQTTICDLLELVQKAVLAEIKLCQTTTTLKRAAMQKLFAYGLRGEAQKQTEIGPVPESWVVMSVAEAVKPVRFGRGKQVPKSIYQETGQWPVVDQGQKFIAGYIDDELRVITPEKPIIIFGDHTRIFKFVDFDFALGADGTKLLLATDGFIPKYLFYALCNLEIPNRGYNRHYTILSEMLISKPSLDEQKEIVAILDAIDRKIDLHRKKRAVLTDLFKTLLHQLMTGEIQVRDLDLSVLKASVLPCRKLRGHSLWTYSRKKNASCKPSQ